ncbi:MAG: radical SAM protein, partial [Desulfobacterales bacterium]|nr:radical SAM protein [Desulfobacterales bacterium]
MIRFIRENNLEVEMFTNGSGVTPEFAENLISENVRVVLKLNTLDPELQDKLAGKKGASKIINGALADLLQAGYPSEDAILAVSTIICRQNLDELPELWKWLRDRNIAPYFEMITPQGDAKQNKWLEPSALEVKNLFTRLAAIDSSDYGGKWEPQPPLVGHRCMRHQFSCLVNSRGDVMPCVGVTIPVGNVREKKLADIIRDSEVFRNLKNFRHTIKGKCHSCKKADSCYGCRGAAYQLTGDYLASDPLCWENL